jgi:hypothetical protein
MLPACKLASSMPQRRSSLQSNLGVPKPIGATLPWRLRTATVAASSYLPHRDERSTDNPMAKVTVVETQDRRVVDRMKFRQCLALFVRGPPHPLIAASNNNSLKQVNATRSINGCNDHPFSPYPQPASLREGQTKES